MVKDRKAKITEAMKNRANEIQVETEREQGPCGRKLLII